MPRRIWALIREPRNITIATAIGWGFISAAGIAALAYPPISITATIGPILVQFWAWFLIVGGVWGAIGACLGWWWVERVGLTLMGGGLVIYIFTLSWLQYEATTGNRLPQIFILCLVLVVGYVRWHRVAGAQTDPSRNIQDDHL